jgi:hypothetical protein
MISDTRSWALIKKKPQQHVALAKETGEAGALELSESCKEEQSNGMLM